MPIKKKEFTLPSVEKDQTLYGAIYLPAQGEIKGILQFSHGMSDYGGRYYKLFKHLAENGYGVAYHDQLGHGKTAQNEKDLGYFSKKEGNRKVIADFNAVFDMLEQQFPSTPHFVMGHSMGSYIVRCFLARGKGDGAILMGTGNKNFLAGMGISLAKIIKKVQGERHRSVLLAKLAFGTYNKKIDDSDHQWAWLSRDKIAQQDILEDPLRNKLFTASAFQDLFTLVKEANGNEVIDRTPKNLPMVFISGEFDPLGPYEQGILNLVKKLKFKGFTNVSVKIFPQCRHELCHEENQEEVFDFVLNWLDDNRGKNYEYR